MGNSWTCQLELTGTVNIPQDKARDEVLTSGCNNAIRQFSAVGYVNLFNYFNSNSIYEC